jgi:hypothetical protein
MHALTGGWSAADTEPRTNGWMPSRLNANRICPNRVRGVWAAQEGGAAGDDDDR